MELELCGKRVYVRVVQGRSARVMTAKFVSETEVVITLPKKGAPEFINKHYKWLERAYKRFLKRKPVFSKGRVLFNGNYLKVEHVESPVSRVEAIGGSLFVHTDNILDLKEIAMRWLEQKTREYLNGKEQIFKRFGVRAVKVKGAKTRWGYCTSKREITFHPLLAALPDPLREYLMYHEIAHLYELNHSWRFKARLQELLPDYREKEKQLRKFVIL